MLGEGSRRRNAAVAGIASPLGSFLKPCWDIEGPGRCGTGLGPPRGFGLGEARGIGLGPALGGGGPLWLGLLYPLVRCCGRSLAELGGPVRLAVGGLGPGPLKFRYGRSAGAVPGRA